MCTYYYDMDMDKCVRLPQENAQLCLSFGGCPTAAAYLSFSLILTTCQQAIPRYDDKSPFSLSLSLLVSHEGRKTDGQTDKSGVTGDKKAKGK